MPQYFNTTDDWLTLIGASLALLALAMVPICIGSSISLQMMKTPSKKKIMFAHTMDDDEVKTQVLSSRHALFFPIAGFIALFYTYLALKAIDPEYINEGIAIMTSILSTALMSNTILLVAKNNIPNQWLEKIDDYQFSFSRRGQAMCELHVTVIHLLIFAISIALSITYAITQHWAIGDLFAVSLIINAIGFLTVDSFCTGFILLCGILIHDLLWLSGSEAIVDITESFSGTPTNIVWPRYIETFVLNKLVQENQLFTTFSITDIIIPGIFVAYCLRFDRERAWNKGVTSDEFDKPFYNAAVVAYAAGAGTSIIAVHLTKKAQSALFYITPALLLSVLLTAIKERNLREVTDVTPFIQSIKKLNFMADRDERPERFVPRSSSTSGKNGKSHSSKTSRSRTRSVSKGKRTRGKTSKPVDVTPPTSTGISDIDGTVRSSPESTKQGTVNGHEHQITSDNSKRRYSSRISKKKQLEDYIETA
ncbi:hypothetical protein CU097_006180 [Rhizopus azygosporus]|uniref:Minor histocompatibility antigen H13 n=2 Tax=Rhizopus TaxID=4842 RepID=A0A367JZF3_RHIAZ|nr:hypothetical protein BCV71DRAFT_206911 [Rhizopus microsporus]RCH95041.1 hypothetical protein CU097_006180 [Rhizopus azygosporus]